MILFHFSLGVLIFLSDLEGTRIQFLSILNWTNTSFQSISCLLILSILVFLLVERPALVFQTSDSHVVSHILRPLLRIPICSEV